jgi:hypothetical protein
MLWRARNDAAGASIADPLFGALETALLSADVTLMRRAAVCSLPLFALESTGSSCPLLSADAVTLMRRAAAFAVATNAPNLNLAAGSPPCHANELRRSRLQLSSPERTVRGRAFARRRISAHGAASRAPGHERGRAARHTPEFEERELWLRMFRMEPRSQGKRRARPCRSQAPASQPLPPIATSPSARVRRGGGWLRIG